MTEPVPVAILRSGHHGGLAIARSLGRMGIPVYGADGARWEPALSSRYCRGRFKLDVEGGSDGESLLRLLDLGERLGRPVLIPATDTGAIWVAEHAEFLRQAFRFPAPGAGLVRTLCDKSRMQELAARSGVATALSQVPRSKHDVERFLETAAFPIMVKATDAARFRQRTGGTKFLVDSRAELFDLYARAEDREDPCFLLQEFIPGEDWMFDGYFDQNSRCLFGVTGKKIRRFPIDTGVTSLGICLHNDAVHQITRDFMRAIGYQGILDIGYRRDSRTGQYKVLDVNPRIGCTFRLFAATNDMDVARALYLDMTGQAVTPAEAVEGRKWLVEDFDLFSAWRSWRRGALSIRDWAHSLRGVQELACFSLDDPLPFLLMGFADCSELWRWLRFRLGARDQALSAAPEANWTA
jgi:predicted ATP-grasp superfamily ATP-dependent carboligase